MHIFMYQHFCCDHGDLLDPLDMVWTNIHLTAAHSQSKFTEEIYVVLVNYYLMKIFWYIDIYCINGDFFSIWSLLQYEIYPGDHQNWKT